MKILLHLLLIILISPLAAQDIGHRIEIEVDHYENDTLITGYYYADRQLVQDTLLRKDGLFVMEGETALHPGMYLAIFRPDNEFVQFMVNDEEQHFTINVNGEDKLDVSFEGSRDNDTFYDYIKFIQKENKAAESLRKDIETAQSNGEENPDAEMKLSVINDKVRSYQQNIVAEFPNSITARLLKSGFDVDIPEFTGTQEEINNQKFYFYKKHFFDFIELGDSVNLRMPYLHQRITNYVDRLTPQIPDSIINTIDYILDLCNRSPNTKKFYTSHFLNTYAKSKIVGMDAVYVHLVDNYYGQGKADWVDEETLIKLKDNADMLRPTLIGKKAQDIEVYQQDGSAISLYDIKSDYMLLYFYAYDCGHCKKSTPFLVEFYEKYKDKGISVLAVCTKRDTVKCWDYIEEKGMQGFYNATDPSNRSRFRGKYDVRQTPKLYIVNEEKEILIKNFPAEEIEQVMDDIIRIENERKEKGSGTK